MEVENLLGRLNPQKQRDWILGPCVVSLIFVLAKLVMRSTGFVSHPKLQENTPRNIWKTLKTKTY